MIKWFKKWLVDKTIIKLKKAINDGPIIEQHQDWVIELALLIKQFPITELNERYPVRKTMDTHLIVHIPKAKDLIDNWKEAVYRYSSGQDVPLSFTGSKFQKEALKKIYLDDYLKDLSLTEFLTELNEMLQKMLTLTHTTEGTYYHRSYLKLYKETFNVLADIIVNA